MSAHDSTLDRRRFMGVLAAGFGAAAARGLLPVEPASAAERFSSDPFTLGVASGDPTSNGIVLWTRLAPVPTDPTYLGTQNYSVAWRISKDQSMRNPVRRGNAAALSELAHSVHVETGGLRPGTDYFYQFEAGGYSSRIGHFRTAPGERDLARQVQFAVATCQDWPSGYFSAYRDMLQYDLDFVMHLGDYTYEYPITWTNRLELPDPAFRLETTDLRTYRLRHTLYKLDADLQNAHAKFPFVIVWDDHEVANDYSGLAPEYALPSPEFTAKRAAAYQAYYEHTPIRLLRGDNRDPERERERDDDDERETERRSNRRDRYDFSSLRIYRRLNYGRLVEFSMLDTRQYRTDNPWGDGESSHNGPPKTLDYTMLGADQERWVTRGMRKSDSVWNIFGNGLLMAELEHRTIEPNYFWNDAWDGYPAARTRFLQSLVDNRVSNPVLLAGDWHSTFANELKLDFKDTAAWPVATEFVTPAISTGGDGTPYGPYYGPMVPFNPHIKYFEGDRRGFLLATVTREALTMDLRFITSVQRPDGTGYTEKRFVVENGRPGVNLA
jgi:alkaline phosphatase D